MKKVFISVVFGLVGFVGLANSAQRSVLIEEFSTYTCPYCPYAIKAVDSLKKVYGDTVTVIQYVQGPSGAESSYRFNYYSIYYVPTTWVDGVVADTGGSNATYGILRNFVETRKVVPSPIVIDSMDFYVSNDTGYVSISFTLEDNLNPSDAPRIFCVITERNVRANSDGITYAFHLMRDIASSPTGEDLSVSNSGEQESFEWSFPVAQNWVADSLGAAFFIQYYNTKEALQAGQMDVRWVSVNESAKKPALELRTVSGGLSFVLPEAGRVELSLYDVSGRSVAKLAHGEFSQGEHTVALPGLSHGVYTAVLNTEHGTKTLKMVR